MDACEMRRGKATTVSKAYYSKSRGQGPPTASKSDMAVIVEAEREQSNHGDKLVHPLTHNK